MSEIALDNQTFVETLKERVRTARIRASLAVSQELVLLYWRLGKDLLARQEMLGWGAKVVDQLAHDLRFAFAGMMGFSARKLTYMQAFADAWPEEEFVQKAAAQIPWFHNVIILQKVRESGARRFYLEYTRVNGWSRAVLETQIAQRRHQLQGQLKVSEQDFYVNTLFYHIKLRCYVVIGLKAGEFKPEYAAKLNFYLSAVDEQLRHETDESSVGILLYNAKNDMVVEYAPRDMNKPVGVAGLETRLVESLPEDLKGGLPTVEALEAELIKTPADPSERSGA